MTLLLCSPLCCTTDYFHCLYDHMATYQVAAPESLVFSYPTVVSANASSYGVGAVLLQKQSHGELNLVAYISCSMTSAKQQYTQIEKKALALTRACEHFADYLLELNFHINTDHKSLIPLLVPRTWKSYQFVFNDMSNE